MKKGQPRANTEIVAPGREQGVSHSIDLERREDRYIIFVQDTAELIRALSKFTRRLDYPETPITRTVYFGDAARGLPPGMSIKARTYAQGRLPGRWELGKGSIFELLELKRTVPDAQTAARHGTKQSRQRKKNKDAKKKAKRDEIVEILRLSGSLLARNTYKSKRREPNISLEQALKLLSQPTRMRKRIDEQLYVHLLETVIPLEDYEWRPLIGTEYERTHFVTRAARMRDVFRATLDRQVTHYSFSEAERGFVGVPLSTENFSRFEIKTDHEKIAGTELGALLEEILVRFRAFRIPSKKYRGLTERSHYNVVREGFRNELPGKRVYAEFESQPVRYKDREHYINLARYIQSSQSFCLYKDNPLLVEKHEHYVCGKHQGLDVVVMGNRLTYARPRVKTMHGKMPLFTIDEVPVSTVPLIASSDLAPVAMEKMKKRETRYVHSRGFLVAHRKSRRVYKVTLERQQRSGQSSLTCVRIEYCGRGRDKTPRFRKQAAIVTEIGLLYRFLQKDPFLKATS